MSQPTTQAESIEALKSFINFVNDASTKETLGFGRSCFDLFKRWNRLPITEREDATFAEYLTPFLDRMQEVFNEANNPRHQGNQVPTNCPHVELIGKNIPMAAKFFASMDRSPQAILKDLKKDLNLGTTKIAAAA